LKFKGLGDNFGFGLALGADEFIEGHGLSPFGGLRSPSYFDYTTGWLRCQGVWGVERIFILGLDRGREVFFRKMIMER
jgi:hypothetical protein